MNITRDEAFDILRKYVKSESLIKHCLSVEAAMRHFAEYYGEDPEKWGIIGLLHDVDYEMYPEEHCSKVYDILGEEGFSKEDIDSISSHGYGIMPGVTKEPKSQMEKVLFMVDELTGLVTAAVLVRPSRSVLDIKTKSVNKKWKDKAFARNVNRDVISQGLEMLDLERSTAIDETIKALGKACDILDLRGNIES